MGHEGNGGWRLGDLISPTLVRASQPTPDLRGHRRARNGGRGRRLKIVSLIILAAIFHPHFASSREAPHAPLVFARPPTTNDESLLAFCRLALRVCALADATALLVEVA